MAHRFGSIFVSASAEQRVEAAREWLSARAPTADVTVIGETLVGPHDLFLRAAPQAGAAMGWRRTTLSLLASELAVLPLAETGRVFGGAARDAIIARALMKMEPGALGRLAAVADTPGFIRTIGGVLDEVRMAGFGPKDLAAVDPDLATFAVAVDAEWEAAGLADRAATLELAAQALANPEFRHHALGHPTLVFDARVWTHREARFVAALLERSPDVMATVAEGDARTLASLIGVGFDRADGESAPETPSPEQAIDGVADGDTDRAIDRAIDRLREHLFVSAPRAGAPDETLTVFSAPGEGRETVEIARRLIGSAAAGTPFDRCAILLRQPEDYRPYLEEALVRADIPAYFAAGVRRPDPGGRAFLSLLKCRAEDYSAFQFAEYLSIGEVPDATPAGEPPQAWEAEDRWVAPEAADGSAAGASGESGLAGDGLAVHRLGEDGSGENASNGDIAGAQLDLLSPPPSGEVVRAGGAEATPSDADPVPGRSLRVPRRWEKLLVEAAVVGGLDRWERRLAGLAVELELQRSGLQAADADDPRIESIDRNLSNLRHLEDYALPLLRDLAALPDEALWAEWLDALGALATRALRHPGTVLSHLGALAPLGPVGPVRLAEVLRVLAPALPEVTARAEGTRYGRVFVGPIDDARGLAFDVVFVPGLAERVFPPKIAEDPILLDSVRETLNAARSGDTAGGRLTINADRVAAERLALKLAIGAARDQVVLSYPRIEAVKARPRVPSFYALEAVRAAEGRLPKFEELAKRAEEVSDARIGWPAPQSAARAIDEAEYDLAVLDDLGLRGEAAVKAAGHLLNSNPHLARALRFRAYRWQVTGWTWADGLINLSDGAAAALALQSPDARAFSATALQHFAACPYRFYLQALQRLRPREEPIGIEQLDPLQRGSIVHQVQFELFTRLQRESTKADPLLPLRPANRDRALETLNEVLDKVAAEYRDRLVPAIDRVWDDGIESIRQDLREWLHRESLQDSPFEPWRFELSFGLPRDPDRDERSVTDPVDLGIGLRLRGAIDLIERTPGGVLRVTDHKTGRYRAKSDAIIQGGELLQPVLYGLAAQTLFPDLQVESGRLYYCTTDGEFRDHSVPINEHTTGAARVLIEAVRGAFEAGQFPALPRARACEWCDYRAVCGPDEERRIRRKPKLAQLERLREYP